MSLQECKRSMGHYRELERVIKDAQYALNNFKELKPVLKSYPAYPAPKNLLTLDGTIPVNYKGKTYNIPIIVWLLDTHPTDRPMVQVQPTSTMTIKPSASVDPRGNVTVPYLIEWNSSSSDLTALLQILAIVFGEAPPVFSTKNSAQSTATPPPPYPSYPSAMPQPYQPTPGTAGYPAVNYSNMPNPGYPPSTAANRFPQPYPSNPSNSTPAYNPYGSNAGYPSAGYPPSSMPYQPTSTSPYPPVSTSGNIAYPSTTSYSPYPSQQPPVAHNNPAAGAAPVSLSTAATTSTASSSSYQLSDDEIKRSLLSAVEDKMRRHIRDLVSTNQAEMEVLRNTQKNLVSGQSKLEEYEKDLKTEMEGCGRTISLLETKIPQLKAELARRSQEESCPPEEAIHTTTPLYKQLLSSYSEELALEDALYVLGDSLRKEVISIEVYLKKVRDLSRKQFMLRALIQKCREKAGLSDVYN